MSVTIRGTDNSASTPAVTGTDGDTGMFFPAADTIAFAEGGTESMRLTSAGNVGIGTSSPVFQLHVARAGSTYVRVASTNVGSGTGFWTSNSTNAYLIGAGAASGGSGFEFRDVTNSTTRMVLDSSGNLIVGATTNPFGGRVNIAGTWPQNPLDINITSANVSASAAQFFFNGANCGLIVCTASTTSYNTSSDYRLKESQTPLTGSGAFIDALQPKTWIWKNNGKKGVGFIAHEAQEVSPSSVVGQKDEVDEKGKPKYQSMEYGSADFIANIIAELQDLRKRVALLESK